MASGPTGSCRTTRWVAGLVHACLIAESWCLWTVPRTIQRDKEWGVCICLYTKEQAGEERGWGRALTKEGGKPRVRGKPGLTCRVHCMAAAWDALWK